MTCVVSLNLQAKKKHSIMDLWSRNQMEPKKKKKTSPQLGCFSLWLAETNKMEMWPKNSEEVKPSSELLKEEKS